MMGFNDVQKQKCNGKVWLNGTDIRRAILRIPILSWQWQTSRNCRKSFFPARRPEPRCAKTTILPTTTTVVMPVFQRPDVPESSSSWCRCHTSIFLRSMDNNSGKPEDMLLLTSLHAD